MLKAPSRAIAPTTTPASIQAAIHHLQAHLAATDSPTSNFARWMAKSALRDLLEGNTRRAIKALNNAVDFANSILCAPGTTEPQAARHALELLTGGATTDDLARHQIAYNALSTASWHLARGDVDKALGRILRAATHLKSACAPSTNSGRA